MLKRLIVALIALGIAVQPLTVTPAEAGWRTKAVVYLGVRSGIRSYARKTALGMAERQVAASVVRSALRAIERPLVARAGQASEASAARIAGRLASGAGKRQNPLKLINPTGSGTNCVRCAIATDKTLGGVPSVAGPSKPLPVAGLKDLYGSVFSKPGSIDFIRRNMAALPEGSRAIIYGARPGTGHVFNALKKNGMVRFLDGQAGGYAKLKDGFQFFQMLRTTP